MKHRTYLYALAMSLGVLATSPATALPVGACHVGAYRLPGGRIIDVGLADGGLRWRDFAGLTGKLSAASDGWKSTTGWTNKADDVRVRFGSCAAGTIDIGGRTGKRIALETRETEFLSKGATLKGRLVMPAGRASAAVVVLLHGSEQLSARDFDPLQRLLPAAGVGTFVYDKRGTGASAGQYTQDFDLLADDAVAALDEARRLLGKRAARIGFQGPSQGGWVAPMAASRAHVDFVLVSFGLAVSVAAEDREAIAFQMGQKGYPADVIAKAQEISAAGAAVFGSGFTTGFEAFEAARARYRDTSWFKDVYGNFTHILLAMSPSELRQAGAVYKWGTPLNYDPMETLSALSTPQLWILGGQDIDAPSGETLRRLRTLIARGKPVTTALYPDAEHGMTEFELAPDGSRVSTRYAAGYFRMMRDFARSGRIGPRYGDARIEGARVSSFSLPP